MKRTNLCPPRFVASLLALTLFGSYNKRVCGSLRSPKPPAVASHTRNTLFAIDCLEYGIKRTLAKHIKMG